MQTQSTGSKRLINTITFFGGLFFTAFCVSDVLFASETGKSSAVQAIGIQALPAESELMHFIADETVRVLGERGITAERIAADSEPAQTGSAAQPALYLASLDSFMARWADDVPTSIESGNTALMGDLSPVAEVVRDHQAFLMLDTPIRQQLRTVFTRAHGAAGPMSIGGLSARGQRDHLVGMMLMDAAGQDPTEYPYIEYESLDALAIGLLTGDVGVASIPVSQALKMPLDGGIRIVASSTRQRQDILKRVPTLLSARIDMTYTNYIGLYRQSEESDIEEPVVLSSLQALSSSDRWSEQVYELGLVDDYTNEGSFTVNVLRELAKLKRFADMLE